MRMTKNKWISTLLITLCVLILIGIGFVTYFLLNPMKDVRIFKLDLESGHGQVVEFSDLAMAPGEHSMYRLLLTSEFEDTYSVSFSFREKKDRSLKQYAFVRIECGEETLYEKSLSEVFQKETFSCDLLLSRDHTTEVKITFYIPEDVGNEAQNTATDFELIIVADNSEEAYE